jgi:hypothetical protein
MIGIPTAKNVDVDSDLMFLLKPVNLAFPIIEEALPRVTMSHCLSRLWIRILIRVILPLGRLRPHCGCLYRSTYFRSVLYHPSAGVTCEDFLNNMDESMVVAVGETYSDGLFSCYGVPTGNTYSVIVAAENYYPIMVDEGCSYGRMKPNRSIWGYQS